MTERYCVYNHPLPLLTVEPKGGKKLGRCYAETYYKVTSRIELDENALRHLEDVGVLGYGQGFGFVAEPVAFVKVPCTFSDTGEIATRRDGTTYEDTDLPVYVYNVTRTCDSGD